MRKLGVAFLSIIFALSTLIGCNNVDNIPTSEVITAEDTTIITEAVTAPATSITTVTTLPPEPEFAEISFLAAGDNLIHSSLYKQANSRAIAEGSEGYDFTYAYENVAELIAPADISVLNQETLICNGLYEPSNYPLFNSPPELGDHMIDIGFDVFTIANNHTLDKGTDGLSACLDYWDSKENSTVVGAYRNTEDASNIRTREVNGVNFAFLSYTESLNGLRLPADSPLVIGDANNFDAICEDIKKAKEIADICVVSLHWGVENSDVISDYQRNVARILSDAGCDIIIGNHPHVLRDIEVIEREDKSQTLVAYSLGNFISAQSVGQNLIGGILTFDIKVKLSDKSLSMGNIQLTPIVTHYDYGYKNVRIYPLSDYTEELANSHGVNIYSRFGYEYIYNVLENTVNSDYLNI